MDFLLIFMHLRIIKKKGVMNSEEVFWFKITLLLEFEFTALFKNLGV